MKLIPDIVLEENVNREKFKKEYFKDSGSDNDYSSRFWQSYNKANGYNPYDDDDYSDFDSDEFGYFSPPTEEELSKEMLYSYQFCVGERVWGRCAEFGTCVGVLMKVDHKCSKRLYFNLQFDKPVNNITSAWFRRVEKLKPQGS